MSNELRKRRLSRSGSTQSPAFQQSDTETEREIDFVESGLEDDEDVPQSDWETDAGQIEEDDQKIPLDHDVHEMKTQSTIIAFGQNYPLGKNISTKELNDMYENAKSSGQKLEKIPLWLDISPPTDTSANTVSEIFKLHELTIDDWFTSDIREKSAFYVDYFQITLTELRYIEDTNILKTYLLHIVMKKNVIITIHSEPVFAINEVISKIKTKQNGTLPSAHWALYAILETIMANYSILTDRLNTDVHNIEQLSLVLLRDDQDEFLGRIGDLKKRANMLSFLVSPKKSFLRFILKSKSKLVSKNLKIYLRDILDDTVRLLEKLNSITRNIENQQETYLAKISLSVNRYSEEENLLMKKFGAIATLFLPVSFVAALFGMNVTVPGQDNPTLSWFFMILTICLIWMIGGTVFFRIYNWL